MTEGLSTGTLIKFLSVYPTKEEEYLYPPLTRIKLDEHVIISQEKFESLFPENDLKSADLNIGFFDSAKKALAAVETIALSFFLCGFVLIDLYACDRMCGQRFSHTHGAPHLHIFQQDDLEIVPEAETGVTICKMSVQLC